MRERAARAVQAVFDELGFPPISDEEVRLAATCLDSRDLPDRDRAADVLAGDRVLDERISGLDVARALERRGFGDVADGGLRDAAPARRRRLPPDLGDHRRRRQRRLRGQRPATTTRGPGHRLPARGRALGAAPAAPVRDRRAAARRRAACRRRRLVEVGAGRSRGTRADEVVVAVGPGVRRGARRDDQRPGSCATCSRALEGVARGGRRTAARPRAALGRRRVHRPRRRARSRARGSRSGSSRRGRR